MNIKSVEAHELERELAALEHTTVTAAVTISLREAEISEVAFARISAANYLEVGVVIDSRQDARAHDDELLFKGDDFTQTDIRPALLL